MRTLEPTEQVEADLHSGTDAVFGLPNRPRFVRELLLAQIDDGMVVDGATQLHVFWGETAKNLLPTLIPLMDGTRTLAEIDGALPHMPAQEVRATVASLFQWGLLEEAVEGIAVDTLANAETIAFFRRYIGTTGINRNGPEAYAKLLATEVVLIFSAEIAAAVSLLKLLLEKTGVSRVTLCDRESCESWLHAKHESTQTQVISLSVGSEDQGWLAKLDDLCSNFRMSWLRVVLEDKVFADIGPLFRRNEVPCYRCFVETHTRAHRASASADRRLAPHDMQFWLSKVAIELVYFLSGIAPVLPAGDFQRCNLDDWSPQILRFAGIPGCFHCRPMSPRRTEDNSARESLIDTAVVFEEYVGSRTRSFSSARTGEAEPFNVLELTKQSKRLPNCQEISLDRDISKLTLPILDAAFSEAPDSATLKLTDLATMLLLTAGIRSSGYQNDTVKRWAATGGNLGSVELFVAARNVDGLAPGYYFYQPREHSLAVLRRHGPILPIEDFMSRTISCESTSLPDALILFTAAFHRVSRKYASFGYRLINLDAGVALSQLHIVARCLGIQSHTAARWADDLIENQLRLDPVAEQSTAVALLHRKRIGGLPVQFDHLPVRTGIPSSTKFAGFFCDTPVRDIAAITYRESRITEADLRLGSFAIPEEFQEGDHSGSETVALPAASSSTGFVGDILRARASNRRYTDEPVSLTQIATMLSFAHAADVKEWPQEHITGQGLTFFVLAQRVAGLRPGLFVFEPLDRSLRFSRGPLSPQAVTQLYVQNEFAIAPVAIWIVGNLVAACARHGAFGHRQLLLRAGAAGNRLWMAALGTGLSGSLVAGVIAGTARRDLGFDGYLNAALLAVTIGYSAQGSDVPGSVMPTGRNKHSSPSRMLGLRSSPRLR